MALADELRMMLAHPRFNIQEGFTQVMLEHTGISLEFDLPRPAPEHEKAGNA